MKDLGILKYFLGIEVCRSQKVIKLCQRKYALELIAELDLTGSKLALTPMEQNMKLIIIEYDKHCNINDDTGLADTLSQFMQSPKKPHLEATYRVVRYVKNESGLDVLMSVERTAERVGNQDSYSNTVVYR
uniref:Uncharacterized protein LOC104211198 n=1 Tax=Nicotiana sylvestris TaxID=4096 RepID=A0A1U7UQY6_NICSY|nr:PREDICTED: uncharacterized protein LOC104211198 [Nicotiana sylvestris]